MNKFLLIISVCILVAGLSIGGVAVYSKIRGIRNNNPLNLELGIAWDGLSPTQTDDRFCQFIDAEHGIRAGARNLMTYAKKGVNTIEKIISTWAPPERFVNGVWVKDNDTEAYIQAVVNRTGFDRNKVISKSAGDYLPLIKAMIVQENGFNPYSDDTIIRGINLA